MIELYKTWKILLGSCQLPHRHITACAFQCYLDMVKCTSIFHMDNVLPLIKEIKKGLSVIVAMWHRETLLQLLFPYYLKSHILVTEDRGADLYASLIKNAGFDLLRPTDKTGMIGQMLVAKRILTTPGNIIVIAVDGPFGPSGMAKPGAAMLAKLSGAPLVPFHCEARYIWRGKTWDKRAYPWPFNEFACKVGRFIHVSPKIGRSGVNDATLNLQSELNMLCQTRKEDVSSL